MAGKNTSVFGIYNNRVELENAVDRLREAGFRNTDISVLFPENQGTKDFAHEKHTKAPEGTATGAGTGAAVGGVLGWLVGIGSLAIPGLGPFIAAGPIMAALAGMGAGGVVGGLAGALIGMGIPEYEAKRYAGRVHEGGILLSVHSDESDWTDKAKEILEHTGATDISSANEAKGDFAKSDKPMPRGKTERPGDLNLDRPSNLDRPKPGVEVPNDAEVRRTTVRSTTVRPDPDRTRDIRRDLPPDPARPVDPDLPPDPDTDLP